MKKGKRPWQEIHKKNCKMTSKYLLTICLTLLVINK